jgi:hypothetical protein
MIRKHKFRSLVVYTASVLPLALSSPVFADASTPGVSNIENFIKTLVNILCVIAGPLCAIFLAIGGYGYITSSGNPEHLDRSKRTIIHSLVGLVIVIAAFVISNGVASIANSSFGN